MYLMNNCTVNYIRLFENVAKVNNDMSDTSLRCPKSIQLSKIQI